MWSATTCAVKGVPSENFTPWRIVSVNVLPPLENLKPLASPGTSLPPSCSSMSWPKIEFMRLWLAAPLVLVTGSSPAGQAPS